MAGRPASIAGSYQGIIEAPAGRAHSDCMKMPAMHGRKKSLISIVDDEACIRESLSSLVRSMGYGAEEYASAEDFLTAGRWEETACLILDVRMPGMGGVELQRRLADTGWLIPTVFLSARATEEEKRRALRAGATDFLGKPVNEEALLHAIRAAIDGPNH
jgi:FixJ family two-component response regulator